MEPTFYHSQAGSDQQALHELQESQPKLTPLKAFETAIRDIDTRLPPRFREGAIRLISILYHKSKSHTFTIHFLQEFYDDDHWIVRKYEKIRKKKNTRDFLLEKFVVNQFDFIKKTPEQMEEVKNISDMARIMYIILIHCNFVPSDYLCLLAIIMT
jgi:pyruvate-formate lyase-activating enzyme